MVSETDLQIDLVEIDGKLQRVMDVIEVVKERQEEVAVNISEIKKAVYDPDQGIYARLRELESWKRTHSRLMWITASSLVGIFTAATVNYLLDLT